MMSSIKKTGIALFLLVSTALIFQACLKDRFDFDKVSGDVVWDADFAIPLAEGRVTIYDVLRQFDTTGLLNVDDDGLIYLKYRQNVYSISGSDILDLPTQSFYGGFDQASFQGAGGFVNGSCYMQSQFVNDFDMPGNERLDSIRFKDTTTTITITINHNFTHGGLVTVTFPYLTKNGVAWSKTKQMPPNSYSVTTVYNDLDGYSFDLTNLSDSTNKVLIRFEQTLNENPSGGGVGPSDGSIIAVTFADITYYSLYGYVGYTDMSIDVDTVHIDLFDQEFSGNIYFKDPQMRIFTRNSYGLPIEFGFNTLDAYSRIFETTVPIIGDNIPYTSDPSSLVTIGYPQVFQTGQTIEDSIVLTAGESNLDSVISDFPQYIIFGVFAAGNPPSAGVVSNFILDTSSFNLELEMILPLWGNANYYRLYDTLESDMSQFMDTNQVIEEVVFRMVVDNGFPFEAQVQAYFCDSNFVVVDSLIHHDDYFLIEAGKVDADGRVDQLYGTTNKVNDFAFPAARISNLKDVKYVLFGTKLLTNNYSTGESIRMYADYTIRLRLGVRVNFSASPNDF